MENDFTMADILLDKDKAAQEKKCKYQKNSYGNICFSNHFFDSSYYYEIYKSRQYRHK